MSGRHRHGASKTRIEPVAAPGAPRLWRVCRASLWPTVAAAEVVAKIPTPTRSSSVSPPIAHPPRVVVTPGCCSSACSPAASSRTRLPLGRTSPPPPQAPGASPPVPHWPHVEAGQDGRWHRGLAAAQVCHHHRQEVRAAFVACRPCLLVLWFWGRWEWRARGPAGWRVARSGFQLWRSGMGRLRLCACDAPVMGRRDGRPRARATDRHSPCRAPPAQPHQRARSRLTAKSHQPLVVLLCSRRPSALDGGTRVSMTAGGTSLTCARWCAVAGRIAQRSEIAASGC